jgi:hypothetical protein
VVPNADEICLLCCFLVFHWCVCCQLFVPIRSKAVIVLKKKNLKESFVVALETDSGDESNFYKK